MDAAKKKKLEAKGWRVGSAADFLGLSDAEAELVDIKVRLARALQERREKAGLSQAELAKKLKTSQPRVANMLAGFRRTAPSAGVDLATVTLEVAEVNGEPAMLLRVAGKLDSVYAFTVDRAAITSIRVVRNPDKLQFLERQLHRA